MIVALEDGLGGQPAGMVIYFAAVTFDPEALAGPLSRHFCHATVIGCSSSGEFTDVSVGGGGISPLALPRSVVGLNAAALGSLADDAYTGTAAAVTDVEGLLGMSLRALDPARHLGLVLIDGVHGGRPADPLHHRSLYRRRQHHLDAAGARDVAGSSPRPCDPNKPPIP